MNLPAINHSDARRSCGILVHAKMLLGAVLVIAPLLPVTLPSWLTIVLVDAGVSARAACTNWFNRQRQASP